jgi:adenosylhomocysteine nucleosidase
MINIVTALACEANPIIQHYRLKISAQAGGFPVYRNESIALIISGMGRYAAASAVGYLQALLTPMEDRMPGNAVPHTWLNVGIAGHKNMDIGTALLAHRVSDEGAEQSYYPCFTFDLPCTSAEVISVAQAETRYTTDAAYDMEAVGFCAAASRFSSFELIHCLKIISDNRLTSHEHINKHVGEELVGNQLLIIEDLLGKLEKLQHALPDTHIFSQDYYQLTQRFRFTVTQQNQLKRLLQRWSVLVNTPLADGLPLQDYQSAKQVLLGMESYLQSKVFHC